VEIISRKSKSADRLISIVAFETVCSIYQEDWLKNVKAKMD
jgi:hypothetical protein